jgi:uncharacterized phiE125 gp8 family phage protein
MGLNLITEPTATAIPTTLLRHHLRLNQTYEDVLLLGHIQTATKTFENLTGLAICEQSWQLTIDCWHRHIPLPRSPLISIDSFDIKSGGIWTPFTDYKLNNYGRPAWIHPITMPVLDQFESPRIKIEYTVGLSSIGADIKQAILFGAAHLYENREPFTESTMNQLPLGYYSIVAQNKVGWQDWVVV